MRQARNRWWLGPAIVVGAVLIAWLALAVLPFRRDAAIETSEAPAVDTIAEGTTERTATIVETGAPSPGTDTFEVTEIQLPPNQLPPATTPVPEPVTETMPPPMTSGQAPPSTPVTRRPDPAPAPVRTTPVTKPQPTTPAPQPTTPAPKPTPPAPRPAPPAATPVPQEISEEQASAALRRYLASSRHYDVDPGCLQIRGTGYSNVGYGFQVWDACAGGGASRRLGVWRVDSKSSELFVRGASGRYGRP